MGSSGSGYSPAFSFLTDPSSFFTATSLLAFLPSRFTHISAWYPACSLSTSSFGEELVPAFAPSSRVRIAGLERELRGAHRRAFERDLGLVHDLREGRDVLGAQCRAGLVRIGQPREDGEVGVGVPFADLVMSDAAGLAVADQVPSAAVLVVGDGLDGDGDGGARDGDGGFGHAAGGG